MWRALAFVYLLSAAVAVRADETLCTAERAGLVACVAGTLCACGYERIDASGLPAGFRWDCGILRPSCGTAQLPATLDPYPYPLPPGLSLERSTTNVTAVTGDHNRVQNGIPKGHR